jgi:hypothetical protein
MKRKYFTLLFLFCISCNPTGTNLARVNPSPSNIASTPSPIKFIPPSGNLSDELPEPIKTVQPSIEDFIFDVKIDFDGILGRVRVNDGELRETPTEYKLRGGKNKIEVFDLVTYCRIAEIYFIDKNQTIDLKNKCN